MIEYAILEGLKFYMKVPLPNGTFTNGVTDYNHLPDLLGLSEIDLSGMRVLDIAANDGFWTFWAESQEADVLAIDVDGFAGYDWSYEGPPVSHQKRAPFSQWDGAKGFWALHKLLGSAAKRENKSIYDLTPKDGPFDLILNFGLLYHLRHPLLALDRTRTVCCGAMVIETHIVNNYGDVPVNVFYPGSQLSNAPANWSGPNDACVFSWLNSAGYPYVFVLNKTNRDRPYARRIFIACVNMDWRDRFTGNPNLTELGDEYRASVSESITSILTNNKIAALNDENIQYLKTIDELNSKITAIEDENIHYQKNINELNSKYMLLINSYSFRVGYIIIQPFSYLKYIWRKFFDKFF